MDIPSVDGYRDMIWTLSHAAQAHAASGDSAALSACTRALNGIARAAAIDRQLADVVALRARITELEAVLTSMGAALPGAPDPVDAMSEPEIRAELARPI